MIEARQRLIIDTDIGTDVDDLWTLAMLPASDEVHLEAITLVYGDVDLRARIATWCVPRCVSAARCMPDEAKL